MFYDNGWKAGSVTLSGNAVIGDSAVVTNSCTVSGNAKILQKAYLADAVTVSDHAVIKGMAYVYGKGNYSGSTILDGDYSNEQTRNSGVGFGWLDDYGWYETADGYVANYDFAEWTAVWSKETSAATNIRQMGAEWAAERTSANGVLNFDGDDDYALVDDALLRSKELQLSMGVLWKGGTAKQEIFRFGDNKAYMAFTPANAAGVAELTITDGNTTETLTASAPLTKGEWSKVTVRMIGGKGALFINGTEVAGKTLSLNPLAVMSAAETDAAVLGRGFKGAVDYLYFSNKETAEPNITYYGSETPDDSGPNGRIRGDVNVDGIFSTADVVMLQKWLIDVPNAALTDWQAGDMIEDSTIDSFDLCIMKRELLNRNV